MPKFILYIAQWETYRPLNFKKYSNQILLSSENFAVDVVLDEEPWFNSTTACTFPDPFFHPDKNRGKNPKIGDLNMTAEESKYDKLPRIQAEQLLGQYGSFAYGNLTVVQDDVTENIIIHFDVFSCILMLKQNNISYTCQPLEDYWFLPNIGDLLFDTTSNPAEYVYVEFYDPREGKIRFERDLNQNEAPGPKDHWPTCGDEQVTSGKDGIICLPVNGLMAIALFYYFLVVMDDKFCYLKN